MREDQSRIMGNRIAQWFPTELRPSMRRGVIQNQHIFILRLNCACGSKHTFDPLPLQCLPLCLGNGRSKMGGKRHKPEEIVTKLLYVEALFATRMAWMDAIRELSQPNIRTVAVDGFSFASRIVLRRRDGPRAALTKSA